MANRLTILSLGLLTLISAPNALTAKRVLSGQTEHGNKFTNVYVPRGRAGASLLEREDE